MTETSGKQYVLWTLDCRCFPRLRLGKHRQSLVHKTYCFPRSQSISVNYNDYKDNRYYNDYKDYKDNQDYKSYGDHRDNRYYNDYKDYTVTGITEITDITMITKITKITKVTKITRVTGITDAKKLRTNILAMCVL